MYINSTLVMFASMKADRTCKHCEVLFKDVDGKVHANHVRWCVKNTTNGDKGSAALSHGIKRRMLSMKGEIKTFDVVCVKCNSTFQVDEHEKLHPKRKTYFCSLSCANRRVLSAENKQAISLTLLKRSIELGIRTNSGLRKSQCAFVDCAKQFEQQRNRKYCSRECGLKHRFRNVNKESLRYYRSRASFKFGIASYPDEFDFSLIEKHGWYKPKNRGDNLGGVSRDHMVSVKYGWQNGVDPAIIAHPANCRLIRHRENSSKGEANFITFEHLLERIESWNEKYKA